MRLMARPPLDWEEPVRTPSQPPLFQSHFSSGEEMHPSKLSKSDRFDPNWLRWLDQPALFGTCLPLSPTQRGSHASLVGGSCSPKRGSLPSSSFLILLPGKPFSLLFF